MAGQRNYLGVAPDVRREQRRQALHEAALDCIVDDSVELSVRSICARARLTPRYFYESFANLDELLLALMDDVGSQALVAGMAAVDAAPHDLLERCRAAFAGAYSVLSADRRRATLLTVTSLGSEVLRQRRRQLTLTLAESLLGYLEPLIGPGAAHAAGARAAAFFMVGGGTELVTSVAAGTLEMTDDELTDAVARLLASSISGLIASRG